MIEFAQRLIESIGIFGAGLFIAIESVVIPLPSELVLLLSGFNVSVGDFAFIPVLIATTTGSLIGALLLYLTGFALTRARIDQLVAKFGKYLGIKGADVDRAFNWFERYGSFVVFFGRLVPLVRSLVSIPAGLAEMNIVRFIALTVAGSGIWNAIWIYIGVQLGQQWQDAESWAKYLDYAVYGAILVLLILLIRRIIKSRRAA